jgi:hypothetical protein
MTKDQGKRFGYMLIAGAPLAPLGLAPGFVYLGGILVKDAMKGIGKGSVAAGKLAKVEMQKRRERQEAKQAEALRLEAERNAPKPKTKADRIRELMQQMEDEIAAAMIFAEDDEEKAAIREIIRSKYLDRLQDN